VVGSKAAGAGWGGGGGEAVGAGGNSTGDLQSWAVGILFVLFIF
jgi:hypothetical protein